MTIRLRIKRQLDGESESFVEQFDVQDDFKEAKLAEVLTWIQSHPINAKGQAVSPVAFEALCDDGHCGSCAVVANGVPVKACEQNIKNLSRPILLEPLQSAPVLRDLWVDRLAAMVALEGFAPWAQIELTRALVKPNQFSQKADQGFGACITCQICLDACPQYDQASQFLGPLGMLLLNTRLEHEHASQAQHRYAKLSAPEGVLGCLDYRQCQKSCPEEVRLDQTISRLKQKVFRQALGDGWE